MERDQRGATERYQRVRSWIRTELPVGASMVRLDVLVFLYGLYPTSTHVKHITNEVAANQRTVRSALDDMIDAGFVVEDFDTNDARYRRYRLSPLGYQRLSAYTAFIADVHRPRDSAA
jgi:DNA-binding MarR family transcriptional regulator